MLISLFLYTLQYTNFNSSLGDTMIIYTIGHSKRTLNEIISILRYFKIKRIIDVRGYPYVSFNPEFNKQYLVTALSRRRIDYVYLEGLSGLRSGLEYKIQSQCIKDESFRSFVAYMETDDFKQALDELIRLGEEKLSAIMCVELLYWECHRSLIADALKVLGHKVLHILDTKHVYEHEFTKCARLHNGKLVYI